MPILNDHSLPSEWIDPDEIPRPIMTIGMITADLVRLETDFHRHGKCQFLLLLKGVLSCEVEGGLWVVPPQSAIWIPSRVLHNIKAEGAMEGYVSFIDPAVAGNLPETCCALSVTPLLRELVIRSAVLPVLYPEDGAEAHLAILLLDEIAAAQMGNLHLPMPADPRLQKMVEMIMEDPAEQGTMQTWAARAGLSERTLARVIVRETGMSFGRWRRQVHIMLAVRWLAQGSPIQHAADKLGYESASSFVTMFRKTLGTSPRRYMAERRMYQP